MSGGTRLTPLALENRLEARLKLKQLKLLVHAGETQNIMRAAQLLNMAQPAATKIIHDLETALDVSLFNRSSRGVSTTMYGDVIIRHARIILSQLRHTSEEILSLKEGLAGRIAVGTHLVAAPTLLPRTILRVKADRPNLAIDVLEGTNDKLLPMLRIGDLDLVLGRLTEQGEPAGLVREVLYYEPVSIVARKGHRLLDRPSLSLADLVHEQWILPHRTTTLWAQIETDFHRAGLEPPSCGVNSMSILANHTMLLESDMIGVMPYQVVEAQHGLVRLPIAFKTAVGPVGLTHGGDDNLTPASRYFIETLREVAQEMTQP
jgi:DNA-binding transcriptional LysR family regulator